MKIALLVILTIIFCFYRYMRFSATHDKIPRGQWAFECFVMSFERYEATKDEHAKAEFFANAMLFYSYADIDASYFPKYSESPTRQYVLEIKELVEIGEDDTAKKEMLELIELHSENCRLKKCNNPE